MSDTLIMVYEKIEKYKNEMIELQKKMTALPAISPENGGKGEWQKANLIKSYMNNIGFDEILEFNAPHDLAPEGTRPNIIGKIKGKDSSKTIWLMAHMDVVPEGEIKLWNTDPFSAVLDGDKLYGRGTEDNQQAITSILFSIKAVKDLKLTPSFNIGVIFVSDEEVGSKYGIKYVLDKADIFLKNDLFIVPDEGRSDGAFIEVSEKSTLWVKIITHGKQCHGSTPGYGVNAFKAGSALLMKLNDLYKTYDKVDPVFDPPESTFEPTKKENNVANINTIPGLDVFYMDCRILPDYPVDKVIEKMKSYAQQTEKDYKVKIEMEFPQRTDAAPPTPVDSPVVKALMKAVKEVYKVDPIPMGIGGGTVAAFFRMKGFHAACWTKLDETLHCPNEYCLVSNMIGDAKVFANIFLQEQS